MNANAELLNFVYQNSQMGMETIDHILEISEDGDFRKYLESQKEEYKTINKKSMEKLNDNGYDEKSISAFNKMSAYIMINFKTLTNKSSSHIAEMLINGSNMGIVDGTKQISKYEHDAEKDILSLMKQLIDFEQKNIEELKKFL